MLIGDNSSIILTVFSGNHWSPTGWAKPGVRSADRSADLWIDCHSETGTMNRQTRVREDPIVKEGLESRRMLVKGMVSTI